MNNTDQQRGSKVQYAVDEALAGQRLDRVVAALHPALTRSAAGELIAQERVQVNGRPCKAATRPIAGARLTIDLPPPPQSEALPEQIPLRVVYEDDWLVVVDKPAGMVVHPAPGNGSGTLVNALLGRYRDLPGGGARPGIVHRLDKDTSGLIAVARTPEAVAELAGQFKQREVRKEYLTLVVGPLRAREGQIRAEIGRDPRHRQRMAVVPSGGRDAFTAYRTEETFRGYTLLRVFPESGRMHQIRVHLAAAGHPVAGDAVYGRPSTLPPLGRQFLHAARLRIRHPHSGEPLDFSAPLPPDLQATLDLLRELARPLLATV